MRNALTGWLRPIAVLAALAGTLALSACGGGSGSVNNPNTPTPTPTPTLFTLPAGIIVAYSQVPTTVKIVGGVPPYQALSNNSAVLPVPLNVAGDTIVLVANPVALASDVPVSITVSDQSGQSAIANVTVRYAPLFESGLTVTPSGSNCGNNVCDGETADVRAVATGIGGAPLPGRQIRFDVVFGPYGIVTSNPAAPIAATLTVVTDAAGAAAVQIQATANATTQQAQIRATDLTTGQQQVANFVVQRTTNADNLSVIPPSTTVTTFYDDSCSSGYRIDYFIFGGTPPYRVSPSFPDTITISPTVVSASGNAFRATTNGSCVNPLTFTIEDAAGKTASATLNNIPGSETRPSPPAPTPPPTLVVSPATATSNTCTGQTFSFIVTGGSPGYNVFTSPVAIVTPPAPPANPYYRVSGLATGSGVTTIIVVDQGIGGFQQTKTATISCNIPTPP